VSYWLRYRGTRFPLRFGETTIGRSPYSTIVVGCSLASRSHARVRVSESGLEIIDAGSANGTTVNGVRIAGTHALETGDAIRIGTDLLEVIEVTTDRAKVKTLKPPAPDAQVDDFDTETGVHTLGVDFVEGIASAVKQSSQPSAMAGDVRKHVDAVITNMEGGRDPYDRADAARLAAIAELAASWFADGSLDEWRGTVLGRLARLARDLGGVTERPRE